MSRTDRDDAARGVPLPLVVFGALTLIAAACGAYALAIVRHDIVARVMLAEGVVYAGACWWLLRRGAQPLGGRALALILGCAVLARAVLLPWPPVSTDIYRYIWDGRVQAAGLNPYLRMPADPSLASLRDDRIYPRINRAETAVTIYPPAAELVFLVATRVSETVPAMKAVMVLFEGLIVWALLRLLPAADLPRERVLLYGWHPLPLFEFAGSGHVDAIAIGLTMAAILAAHARRPVLSGLLLGAGTAAKYLPAIVAPAIWRRWDWRQPAGFVAAIALLYAPYLVGAGRGVLGFLPGYVQEEKIGETGIFWLAIVEHLGSLPRWLPPVYFGLVAAALLGLGLAAASRRSPERVSLALVQALLGLATLALTPHHPWYFTWLVPLLCVYPATGIVWLTCAAPLIYGFAWTGPRYGFEFMLYGPALLLLALEAFGIRLFGPPTSGAAGRQGARAPTPA